MGPARSPEPWCDALRDIVAGDRLFDMDARGCVPEYKYGMVHSRGLSNASFNGRVGILQRWDAGKARWQVKFASSVSMNAYFQGSEASVPSFDEPSRLLKSGNLRLFDLKRFRSS